MVAKHLDDDIGVKLNKTCAENKMKRPNSENIHREITVKELRLGYRYHAVFLYRRRYFYGMRERSFDW